MKNILKVVFVIIGTLIGAGFASGQEIYTFFFSHGIEGIYGIFISCILMGVISYKALTKINKYNISTYKDFLDSIINQKKITNNRLRNKDAEYKKNKYQKSTNAKFGKKENANIKNKKEKNLKTKNIEIIKEVINNIINIFILVTFFIMIAGFGAYFEQELGINNLIGSSILAILCFIIFMSNVEGVIKASELLVPILIIFLIIVGVLNFNDIHFLNIQDYISKTSYSNFIVDAVIYSSYNSILLIPVLITLKNYLKDKKQILGISTITTVITITLSMIIFLVLTRVDVDITKLEMPVVYVVSHMAKFLRYIYGFIILGSIFTTAISLGVSFLQNMTKNKRSYTQLAFIMCITSIIISNFGFSNLVNSLYPIFGGLGSIQIILLLL